jgi:hypothetical protein
MNQCNACEGGGIITAVQCINDWVQRCSISNQHINQPTQIGVQTYQRAIHQM